MHINICFYDLCTRRINTASMPDGWIVIFIRVALSDHFSGMRRQPSAAKDAEYLKTDSTRILNNIFRVRLGKILKNINLLYILRLSLTDVKLGM
jgi:hypothetical protein